VGHGRVTAAAFAAALAVALSGCGPLAPQAPGREAHRLNTSLSALSTACGHAYETQAFDSRAGALTGLDRQAASQVPTIARIYKRNPKWIFQGKTVAELVQMAESYLTSCGLKGAAGRLHQATAGGHRGNELGVAAPAEADAVARSS
jgi:hypothetical protein